MLSAVAEYRDRLLAGIPSQVTAPQSIVDEAGEGYPEAVCGVGQSVCQSDRLVQSVKLSIEG